MPGRQSTTHTVLVPMEAVYSLADILEMVGAILGMEVAKDLEHADPDIGWVEAANLKVYFNKEDDTPGPDFSQWSFTDQENARIENLEVTINGMTPNQWMVSQVIDQEANGG